MIEGTCRNCDFAGTIAESARHAMSEPAHQVQPAPGFVASRESLAFGPVGDAAWAAIVADGNKEGLDEAHVRRVLAFSLAMFSDAD